MAISIGDAILKITGDTKGLDQSLKNSENQVQSSAQKMQKSLMVVGAAFTALGAAGLKFVGDARDINSQLGSTAITLNKTTKEMRDLTLATTNVTFPIKSVVATFDLLTRAGVRNEEQLVANANAFDALADATGSSAEVVADILIPALKAMGEELPITTEEMDRFTWLTKNTTTDLSEFGSVMNYVAMYGENLNVSLDDMIAIMAVLESKGKGGATATRLFRTAVTQAADGAVTLNEALGITQDEIDKYRNEMDKATGITQKHADAMNKQYGIMDKVKQKWSELTLSAGSFLTPLEPILAAMTALGPLMIFLSTSAGIAAVKWGLHTAALIAHKVAALASAIAIKAVTAAQWLWNAAMTANPIGLIIMAIGALVAAGILLWKNWDKISAFFINVWEKMKDGALSAWEALKTGLINIGKGILTVLLAPFRGFLEMLNKIIGAVQKIPLIGGKIPGLSNIANAIEKAIEGIAKITFLPGELPSYAGWEGRIPGPLGRPIPAIVHGGEIISQPNGVEHSITNNFNISQLVVREEADVRRVARELYRLQQLRT